MHNHGPQLIVVGPLPKRHAFTAYRYVALAGYLFCFVLGCIAIPHIYPPVKWYYLAVAFLFVPFFALANAYAAGLTDQVPILALLPTLPSTIDVIRRLDHPYLFAACSAARTAPPATFCVPQPVANLNREEMVFLCRRITTVCMASSQFSSLRRGPAPAAAASLPASRCAASSWPPCRRRPSSCRRGKACIAGAIIILMIRTPTQSSCRLQRSEGIQHSRQPMPVPSQNALLGRSSSYAASRPNICCIRAAGEAVG